MDKEPICQNIRVLDKIHDIDRVVTQCIINRRNLKLLALDLEWPPFARKSNAISIIQLGTEKDILIIRISELKQIPDIIKSILVSPRFIKLGVGIENDIRRLKQGYKISVIGFYDLRWLVCKSDVFMNSTSCQMVEMQSRERPPFNGWSPKVHSTIACHNVLLDQDVLDLHLKISFSKVGLKELYKVILGMKVSANSSVRTSNWSNR